MVSIGKKRHFSNRAGGDNVCFRNLAQNVVSVLTHMHTLLILPQAAPSNPWLTCVCVYMCVFVSLCLYVCLCVFFSDICLSSVSAINSNSCHQSSLNTCASAPGSVLLIVCLLFLVSGWLCIFFFFWCARIALLYANSTNLPNYNHIFLPIRNLIILNSATLEKWTEYR